MLMSVSACSSTYMIATMTITIPMMATRTRATITPPAMGAMLTGSVGAEQDSEQWKERGGKGRARVRLLHTHTLLSGHPVSR